MTAWLPLVLIALAVLLASLRLCLPPRPPRARLSLLLALQLAAALLLGLTLFPPRQPVPADTLLIASAGTTAAALASTPAGMRLRLPEAPALADVGRVPDLATALRRHPGTRELVVVGQGLPARDRDAALPPLRFLPAPAPRGLVELQAPAPLAAGARFEVGTRVQGLARARVELLDPAGHRVAIGVPGGDGRVRLVGVTSGDPEDAVRSERLRADLGER
ncbi:MAG: carboxypeptidase regulatory-like domain-containing protein, partial [Stenotrophomonas acidaminiphila]|nr:carboxypeptidase regulatory-like domain-containing protein [Stenotrophomonas acidaminiphila]